MELLAEEVPGFAFQFKSCIEDIDNILSSLSPIYELRRINFDTLGITQSDKRFPEYGDEIIMHMGDYLIPRLIIENNVFFTVMGKDHFERKFITDRT